MTDVRRPEEAFRIRLYEILLDTVRSGAPNRQPAVAMVIVEKHHETLLVPDEERGPAVAQTLRRLGQGQTDCAHLGERFPDLVRRKPAHDFILKLLAHRAQLRRTHRVAELLQRCLRNLLAMELFDSLLDDEILVQHPETPVAEVLAQHRELRSAYGGLLATLVVPDPRLSEIARQVPLGASIPVSVITSGGAGGLLALARHYTAGVEIASVEPTLRDLDDLAGSAARVVSAAGELRSEVGVFIELPYAPGWEAAVEVIEAAGLYGKIAVGKASPRQVVEQLSILIEADLPFKITSSLEGDWLALLTAVEALVAGASVDDAAEMIRPDDRDRFGTAVSSWDQSTQSRMRRRVRRLGTDRVQDAINNLAMNKERPAP